MQPFQLFPPDDNWQSGSAPTESPSYSPDEWEPPRSDSPSYSPSEWEDGPDPAHHGIHPTVALPPIFFLFFLLFLFLPASVTIIRPAMNPHSWYGSLLSPLIPGLPSIHPLTPFSQRWTRPGPGQPTSPAGRPAHQSSLQDNRDTSKFASVVGVATVPPQAVWNDTIQCSSAFALIHSRGGTAPGKLTV